MDSIGCDIPSPALELQAATRGKLVIANTTSNDADCQAERWPRACRGFGVSIWPNGVSTFPVPNQPCPTKRYEERRQGKHSSAQKFILDCHVGIQVVAEQLHWSRPTFPVVFPVGTLMECGESIQCLS